MTVVVAARGSAVGRSTRLSDRLLLLALAAIGGAVVTGVVIPGLDVEDVSTSWWARSLGIAGYAVLLLAGVFAVRRPDRPLVPLVAVAALWDATAWADLEATPTTLRLVFLAAPLLLPAALADLGRRWSGTRGRASRRCVSLLYAVGALAAAGHLLGYDPYNDPRCRLTCAQASTPWSGDPTATHVTALLGNGVLTVTALFAAGLLGFIAARATPRWSEARAVIVALLLAEATTVAAAVAAVRLPAEAAAGWGAVFLGRAFCLLAVGAAIVLSGWAARRAVRAVARLGEGLSEPDHLEASLRRALRDPGLQVQFWYPEDTSWVDVGGTTVHVALGADRVTILARNGAVVARLVHGTGASPSPELGVRLNAAALLAVDNARLAVVGRTRLSDIRASQARIVARGDAERRRLERDLHDGAQQQLVSVALFLRMARDRARAADPSGPLGQAEQQAQRLVADLREIAHGVSPAVLTEEGVAAAVLALVESATVPVSVTRLVAGRYDGAVEMAAYAVVDEALVAMSISSPDVIRLEVVEREGALRVRVACDQAPYAVVAPALRDVEDRVGALGGTVAVVAGTQDGTYVDAIVPHDGPLPRQGQP